MAEIDPSSKANAKVDERQLLPRHCNGDRSAFAQLIEQYQAPVYGYLIRCGVPPAARDDLFQDIFLKIHHAAASYQPSRPLKAWLFTVVANTVRSHYRKKRVAQLVYQQSTGPLETQDDSASAEEITQARETADFLERSISKLPFGQREVVLLCCVESLDQKTVASMLELPVNTVKTLLRRGRMELARGLVRLGAVPVRVEENKEVPR